MKKKKRYLFLLLLLCGAGVVYAMLLSRLGITGSSLIKGNEWDVHFKNMKVSEGSVNGTSSLVGNTGVLFNANLDKPGDYYEFSVDVINSGSIDAMVGNYSFGDISDIDHIVDFKVTYSDGVEINKLDRLTSSGEDKLLIRVEYRSDVSKEDLNTGDIEANFEFEINYVQDDGSSNERLMSLRNVLISDVKNVNGMVFNKTISSGEEGVYQLGDSYFFRGGKINNNVVIDNTCYYVIRTTDDGDIRLLYNGEYTSEGCISDNKFIGESAFNSDITNPNYVDSEIRSVLLDWYNENLIKYDNSIVGGYCSDTRIVDGKYYNKIKAENGIVDLDCDNVIDDKVGLLNVDEILLAGYGRNGSYRAYIDANGAFYSMSIYSNNSSKVRVVSLDQYAAKGSSSADDVLGVRPVITVKGNVGLSSGDGSIENPYILGLRV